MDNPLKWMALKWVTHNQPVLHSRQQRIGRREGCREALGENLGETALSADLGGSSNYSNVNFGF